MVYRGIPVLAPERAVMDLARFTDRYELVGSIDQSVRLWHLDVGSLERRVRAEPRLPGRLELEHAMSHYLAGSRGPRSRYEVALARHVVGVRMPGPLLNVVIDTPRGPFMVDLWWPQFGVALELDDTGHAQPSMVASDALREVGLAEASVRLERVPNEAVDAALPAVLDQVEAMLRRSGWRGRRLT
jgi:very-short-patch-repair endonuclease